MQPLPARQYLACAKPPTRRERWLLWAAAPSVTCLPATGQGSPCRHVPRKALPPAHRPASAQGALRSSCNASLGGPGRVLTCFIRGSDAAREAK